MLSQVTYLEVLVVDLASLGPPAELVSLTGTDRFSKPIITIIARYEMVVKECCTSCYDQWRILKHETLVYRNTALQIS